MLQNVPNQHMLLFLTVMLAKHARCSLSENTNVYVKYHEQTAILVTAIVVFVHSSPSFHSSCSSEVSANWGAAVSDLRIVHLIKPTCVQISDGSMERSEHDILVI